MALLKKELADHISKIPPLKSVRSDRPEEDFR